MPINRSAWLGMTFGANVNTPPVPLYAFWNVLLADAALLGMSTLRVQCDWSLIESPQGVYDWSFYDDVISHCNAASIAVCLTLRGAPSWALATASQQATTEPWYLMDATLAAGFATVMATRYNGRNGHGYIDYLGFNEDFNIHNTQTTQNTLLNQTVTSGLSYATLTVNALTTPISPGVTCVFGNQSGAGQRFLVSVQANKGDTSLTITNTSGGTFVASANQSIGAKVSVLYFGEKTSTYAGLYDGTGGVKSNAKQQPARDAQFFSPVFKAVYSAVKAASPTTRVGTASLWWTQPMNSGGVPNTPTSNHTAFVTQLLNDGCTPDWIDVHYYSNKVDPSVGNNQVNTFAQVCADIKAVLASFSLSTKVWVTEFGWQTFAANTTSSTPITAPGIWTISVASIQGIRQSSTLLIDANTPNAETVSLINKSNGQITADFVNTHSGTYSVQVIVDCDVTAQATRYQYMLDTARTSGVVDKLMFFTLDYKLTGFGAASLVQNGFTTPNVYGYLPAFFILVNYAQQYPTWAGETIVVNAPGLDGVSSASGLDGNASARGLDGLTPALGLDGKITTPGLGGFVMIGGPG